MIYAKKFFCANVCENVKTPIFFFNHCCAARQSCSLQIGALRGPRKEKPSKTFSEIYHSSSLISFSWIAHLSCREVQDSYFFPLFCCCTQFQVFPMRANFSLTGGRIFVKTGRKLLEKKRVDNMYFDDVDIYLPKRNSEARAPRALPTGRLFGRISQKGPFKKWNGRTILWSNFGRF